MRSLFAHRFIACLFSNLFASILFNHDDSDPGCVSRRLKQTTTNRQAPPPMSCVYGRLWEYSWRKEGSEIPTTRNLKREKIIEQTGKRKRLFSIFLYPTIL